MRWLLVLSLVFATAAHAQSPAAPASAVDLFRPSVTAKALNQITAEWKVRSDSTRFACVYGHKATTTEGKTYLAMDSISTHALPAPAAMASCRTAVGVVKYGDEIPNEDGKQSMGQVLTANPEWTILILVYAVQKLALTDDVPEVPRTFTIVRLTPGSKG